MNSKHRDFQAILGYLYGLFVVLVTLWIYVKTLAPTVSFFDSGELISAAYSFGVAHPPGYPLYVLLGWLFTHLPFGTEAYRVNLMSACFASLASLMVYGMTYLMIQCTGSARSTSRSPQENTQVPERMLYPVIAMIAALSFAFSITHWQHAVIAEVYSLNAFLCGLLVLLLVTWWMRCRDAEQRQKGTWLLYLVALVFGLGFGNHQTISLFFFAAAFLVLVTRPRLLLQVKPLLLILLCLALGLSIYLLVPIRAAQNPAINWGSASNWRQFTWLVTREGYQNVPRGGALHTFWHELTGQDSAEAETDRSSTDEQKEDSRGIHEIWRQSLLWKQLKSFDPLAEFGYLGLALAVLGVLYGLWASRPLTLTLLIAVISFVCIVVLIGDPQEENIFLLKEFHTPAYLLVAVWIGLGAIALTRAVLWLGGSRRGVQYTMVFGLALYLLILPAAQMLKNLKVVNRRRNYVAYDYASNVLTHLAPRAILFTWGDSGAFPLWYLQIVEGQRQDVTLIHVPHLTTEWYVNTLPADLFMAEEPFQRHAGSLPGILDEIVQKHMLSRPVYFDFSSIHSVPLPYEFVPYGITYKVAVDGDRLDEQIWDRYRFRGILDETRIARDPDVDRTFLMYGSARVELGHYFLQVEQTEKAAREFNAAVQFDSSLGDRIVRALRFQDKLAGNSPASAPEPEAASQ